MKALEGTGMQHRLPLPPPAARPSVRFGSAPGRPPFLADPGHPLGATQIARGVARLFESLGYRTLVEMRLAGGRRVDVIGLDARGRFAIAEIKSGPADFRADRKWRDYLTSCDDFYFAVAAGFPLDLLPEDTGIVVADRFGGEVSRPSNRRPMATVARNRQILLFAHTAGGRLYRLQNSAL